MRCGIEAQIDLRGYMKIKQAAALIGAHPDTLRRWERVGKLRPYRHPLNRYRLYLKDDLVAFLRGVRQQS